MDLLLGALKKEYYNKIRNIEILDCWVGESVTVWDGVVGLFVVAVGVVAVPHHNLGGLEEFY